MTFSTAATIDALLTESTAQPYRDLPRAVVLVASPTATLYSGSSGYADLPPSETADLTAATPITQDSIFELYSCTKLVTAIAALQLVEQGKLALSDDAAIYVPEVNGLMLLTGFEEDGTPILKKNEEVITVEMLLCHTAGFAYDMNSEKLAKWMAFTKTAKVYTPEFTKATLASIPLVNVPGKNWLYGMNNDWLSWVVEAISGLDLESYFQTFIFKPLGITDISFLSNPSRIPMATLTSSGAYTFSNDKAFSQTCFLGGAGLAGSPASYIKIVQSLLPSFPTPLLKKETIDLMFLPHLKTPETIKDLQTFSKNGNDPYTRKLEGALNLDADYGYGGLLTGRELESGRKARSLTWSGAANTFWCCDRESEVAFVVFTNVWPYGVDPLWALWEKVEKEIYKGLPAK